MKNNRRTSGRWGMALAGLALLGCGTGAEPGRTAADLAYVEESTVEGRADLYIDPSVSWRPMTLAQLDDSASAIPVEVDIYGGVAVAWIRREGATAYERRRSDIVGLFRVLDHVDAPVPPRDEVRREGDGPVYIEEDRFAGTVNAGAWSGRPTPKGYCPGWRTTSSWTGPTSRTCPTPNRPSSGRSCGKTTPAAIDVIGRALPAFAAPIAAGRDPWRRPDLP